MSKPRTLPSSGGAYLVSAKGRLEQKEATAGPRDDAHQSRRPAPAAAPVETPSKEA